MKKIIQLGILVTPYLISCQKQKVWEFEVLPKTCYADAYYIHPEFQPRGYRLEMKGNLKQDVIISVSGKQSDTDGSEAYIGFHDFKSLKAGLLNYSDSAEIYVEDLKIIISGSDTTLYPVRKGNNQDKRCLPLGDIKIKLTFN